MALPSKGGSVAQGALQDWPRIVAVGVTDSQYTSYLHQAIITGHTSIADWVAAILRRELAIPLDE